MSRRTLKPSPYEESEFLKKERERKRLQRLVQVREQSKCFSKHIRNEYKRLCSKEAEQHESEREEKAVAKRQSETNMLRSKLQCYVSEMGQGHQNAEDAVQDSEACKITTKAQQERNKDKMEERFQSALKESNKSSQRSRAKREGHIKARERALDIEKARAKEIAAHPPPKQEIEMHLQNVKGHRVMVRSADSFACTHYSLPMHTVIKRPNYTELHGPSGVDLAEQATQKYQQSRDDVDLRKQEQEEKALMRHNHALAQIRMEKAHGEGLKELEQLERKYRSSRQQTMAELPENLFQPAQRQIDNRKEKQKEMERAFERPFIKKSGTLYATELSEGSSMVTRTVVEDLTSEDDSSLFSQVQSSPTPSSHTLDSTRSPSPISKPGDVTQEESLGGAGTHTGALPVHTLSIGNMDNHLTETASSLNSGSTSTKSNLSSLPGISPLSVGNIDDTGINLGEVSSESNEGTSRANPLLSSHDQRQSVDDSPSLSHAHSPGSEDATLNSILSAVNSSTTPYTSVISSDDSTVKSLLSDVSSTDEETDSNSTLKDEEEEEEEDGGRENSQHVVQNLQYNPEALQHGAVEEGTKHQQPTVAVEDSHHPPDPLVVPGSHSHSSEPPRQQSPSTSQEEHTGEDAASRMTALLAVIARRQDMWMEESTHSQPKPISVHSNQLKESAMLGQMKPLHEETIQEESEVGSLPSTPLSVATLLSSGEFSSDIDETQLLSATLQSTLSWASLQEASQLLTPVPKPSQAPPPHSSQTSAMPQVKGPVLPTFAHLSLSSTQAASHQPLPETRTTTYDLLGTTASAYRHHYQDDVIPGTVIPLSANNLPVNSISGGVIRPTVSPSVQSQASSSSLGQSLLQDQPSAHSSLFSGMDSFDSFASLPAQPLGHIIKPIAPPSHLRHVDLPSLALPVSSNPPILGECANVNGRTSSGLVPVQPSPSGSTGSSAASHSYPSVTALSSSNQVSFDSYSPGLIHFVPGLDVRPASNLTLQPLPSPIVHDQSPVSLFTPLAPAVNSQPTPPLVTAASFELESSLSVSSHSDPPYQPSSAHHYPTDPLLTESHSLSASTPLSSISTDLQSADLSGSIAVDSKLSQSISDQSSISALSSLTPQSMIESLLRGQPQLSSANVPHQGVPSVSVTRNRDILSLPGEPVRTLKRDYADLGIVSVYPTTQTTGLQPTLHDPNTTAASASRNIYSSPQFHNSQFPSYDVSRWSGNTADTLLQDLSSNTSILSEEIGTTTIERSCALLDQNSPRLGQSEANYQPSTAVSASGSRFHVASFPVTSGSILESALDQSPLPLSVSSELQSGTTQASPSDEDHSTKQMSLQEAFLQKRKSFVQNSDRRKKEAKIKAARSTESRCKPNKPKPNKSRGISSSTRVATATPVVSSLLSRSKRSVTFSSPVSVLDNTGLFSPPDIHSNKVSSEKERKVPRGIAPVQPRPRKMKKQEIHAVNQRLCSQLAEVCQKKAEEEKVKAYKTNRTRVKELEQKLQDARKQRKNPKTPQQTSAPAKPLVQKPFK